MSNIDSPNDQNRRTSIDKLKQGAQIAAAALTFGTATPATAESAETPKFDSSYTREQVEKVGSRTEMSPVGKEMLELYKGKITFNAETGAVAVFNADGTPKGETPPVDEKIEKILVSGNKEQGIIHFRYIWKRDGTKVAFTFVTATLGEDNTFWLSGGSPPGAQ
jgi:hypothetical protein